jgi:hypothetical protein
MFFLEYCFLISVATGTEQLTSNGIVLGNSFARTCYSYERFSGFSNVYNLSGEYFPRLLFPLSSGKEIPQPAAMCDRSLVKLPHQQIHNKLFKPQL